MIALCVIVLCLVIVQAFFVTGAAPWPHLPRTNCSTPSPRTGSHLFLHFLYWLFLFCCIFLLQHMCVCLLPSVYCFWLFEMSFSYHIVHFGCVARFAEFWHEDPAGATRVEGEVVGLAQE